MITEINANANLVHTITSSSAEGDDKSMAEVIAIQQPIVASSVNNLPEKVNYLSATEATDNNKQQEETQEIESVVSNISDYVQTVRRELEFTVDEESGLTVVKVFNKETDELIRQIPSEDFLKLAKTITDYKGTLLDVNV
jgi:flagellar protein FlaG